MENLIGIILPLVFLLLGYTLGKRADRKHLRAIEQQSAEMEYMLVTQLKTFPHATAGNPPQLVVAEVVIATDYFKSFLSSWRGVFGGEMKAYRSLLNRARQEVLIRLQTQAVELGFNALCNVRFDSADIAGATMRRRATAVALIASATAYKAAI